MVRKEGQTGLSVDAGEREYFRDLDRLILGTVLMFGSDAMGVLYPVLRPEHFLDRRYGAYWSICRSIVEDGGEVTPLAIRKAAVAAGYTATEEGQAFLQLVVGIDQYDVPSGVLPKALTMVERYLRGQMVTTFQGAAAKMVEPFADAFGIMQEVEGQIYEAVTSSSGRIKNRPLTRQEQAEGWWQWFVDRRSGASPPVPIPIARLTSLLAGAFDGEMITVAARPSIGKSAFAGSWQNALGLRYGIPSLMLSCEMSREQLIARHAAIALGIDLKLFRTPDLIAGEDVDRLQAFMRNEFAEAPIYIEECPGLTPAELRLKVRHHVAVNKIRVVFVDYLQLMSDPAAVGREQEVSKCSRAIKAVAMECCIPVVAMSQLNRAVEVRGDKTPVLSDLRESGAIEQDSDCVVFLHRPEVYGQMAYEDGEPTEGTAQLIVAKQRNGPIGVVRCAYVKERALFANLQAEPARVMVDGEPF